MSVSSIAMTDAAPTAAPPLSPRRSSSFGGSQKDLYVAPEKKTVGEIMEQKEGEDEAMARYKAQLLGGAAAGAAVSEDGDKRRRLHDQRALDDDDRLAVLIHGHGHGPRDARQVATGVEDQVREADRERHVDYHAQEQEERDWPELARALSRFRASFKELRLHLWLPRWPSCTSRAGSRQRPRRW